MGLLPSLLSRLLDALLVAGRPAPPLLRRLGVLVLGLVAITAWQMHLADAPERLDGHYKVTATPAAQHERDFFFFRYHLGLYPLASDAPPRADTREEAERLLRTEGSKLRQDVGDTIRSGDHGRVSLYYVDKWLGGDARRPSLKRANELGFVAALDLLFVAAWWVDWTFFGLVLVAFFGSSPVQLYSAYVQEGYASWPITVLVLLLAVHLPLLVERPRVRWLLAAAATTGLVVAAVRTWRPEVVVLLASACATYALLSAATPRDRAAAVAVALLAFGGGEAVYRSTTSAAVSRTREELRAAGGTPSEGTLALHSELWHSVWRGLGDFDKTKGHEWDDRNAYRAALPVVERAAGRSLALDLERPFQNETFARGYGRALRDLVLADIAHDPRWYLEIVGHRVRRLFTEAAPVELALSESKPTGPSSLIAFLAVPLALALYRVRGGFFTKLILFPVPLAIVPLGVYSGGGMVLYSCFHVVAAAVLVLLVAEGMRARLGRLRRTADA